ncbi:YtxH domain-containing protein [Isoptericola croceus]|uniref:YtxH domain-containing protein n=1 Tax=Isoptericola croceus TaxID=3031406 RepID=UPI0023F84523|nr:YtxH domain-containing protein [Isoptericola croceus]
MKATTALVLGAALGYFLGTEKGRATLDQAKGWATDTWNDPRVQEKVGEFQSKVSEAQEKVTPS